MFKSIDVNINDLCWTVQLAESGSEDLKDEDGNQAWGITFTDNLHIYIQNKNLAPAITKRIILHELCHAFIWSYGHVKDSYNEEELCYFFQSFGKQLLEMSEMIYKELFVSSSNNHAKTKNKPSSRRRVKKTISN
jgi:hypothetical protein